MNEENIENSEGSSSMRDLMPKEETTDGNSDLEKESEEVSEETSDEGGEQTPAEQAEEKSDSEETFANNFDPKTLPPELQQAYKQMQSDYTKKTQEIAEVRRNAESYQRYQALINYLGEHPDIAEQVLFNRNKPVQEQEEQEQIPDDPRKFADYVREKAKKDALAEMMKVYQNDKQQEAKARYIQEQAVEASNLDPRLNSDEQFGRIISSMVLSQKDLIDKGQKTIVQATKEAIETYDSYVKNVVEQEKQKLTEQARNKKNPVPQSSPSDVKEKSKIPQSIREAFDMSFSGK